MTLSSTAVETAIAQCTSRWAMARGHRFNTSIVLAAVHGLSGLFRAVSAVEPFTLSPPSHSVPVPNRPTRLCGRKPTLNQSLGITGYKRAVSLPESAIKKRSTTATTKTFAKFHPSFGTFRLTDPNKIGHNRKRFDISTVVEMKMNRIFIQKLLNTSLLILL